ncbi:MAG: DUF4368 domain-containing protein [Clostridiales bacterium]|nr:DUF4368 domain-containing protein [Clostridiales bacterium]
MKKRLAGIDKILQSMYEDKAFGKISAGHYASISAALEKEETDLKRSLTEIQTALSQKAEQNRSAKDFADLIENYAPITKLDEAILNTCINKITINEIDGENKTNGSQIKVESTTVLSAKSLVNTL